MKNIKLIGSAMSLSLVLGMTLNGAEPEKTKEKNPGDLPPIMKAMHADYNCDGKVTRDEFVKHHVIVFAAMDVDGDGKVSRDEFKKNRDARFKEVDADTDNAITFEELVVYWVGPTAKTLASEAKPMEPGKGSHFDSMDTSRDNALTLNERVAFVKYRFIQMDKDKNGKITIEELIESGEIKFEKKDQDKDGSLSGDEWQFHWIGPVAVGK